MIKRLWYALPFTGEASPKVVIAGMRGVIAADGGRSRSLNLEAVQDGLDEAFAVSDAKAVVLAINSPGGSPTQSRMIHDYARHLSKKEKKPLITYIEDVGASGGYMLALAGDEIYADPYAIVGSIGVIAGGFGFQDAIAKLGVERRVYTAGDNKSQLDPFKAEDPEDIARLKGILDKTHGKFIAMVKERRGGRLKAEDDKLFDGKFWVAEDAVELGLIDGVEDLFAMLRRRFGDEVKIKKIDTEKKGLIGKLLSGALTEAIGPDALLAAANKAGAWARFGK